MSSESDSDAPEELTLSQSKNMEKERLKGQRHAALEEESKKKEKRRRINERNIKQKQEADFIKLVQDEPEQEQEEQEQEEQEEQEEQDKDDDEKRKKRKRRKKNDKVLETETKVYNVIAINDDKLTKLTMKRFNPEGKSKFNNFKNEMLYGKKNKRTKSDQIIASFAKRSVR